MITQYRPDSASQKTARRANPRARRCIWHFCFEREFVSRGLRRRQTRRMQRKCRSHPGPISSGGCMPASSKSAPTLSRPRASARLRSLLAEYGLADDAHELNRIAAMLAREEADRFSTSAKPRFVAGSMGPTTKSISITGGVTFEQMSDAYRVQAEGLIEGGRRCAAGRNG